jgi:hypothetical protein
VSSRSEKVRSGYGYLPGVSGVLGGEIDFSKSGSGRVSSRSGRVSSRSGKPCSAISTVGVMGDFSG